MVENEIHPVVRGEARSVHQPVFAFLGCVGDLQEEGFAADAIGRFLIGYRVGRAGYDKRHEGG